jgi:Sulfate permease family
VTPCLVRRSRESVSGRVVVLRRVTMADDGEHERAGGSGSGRESASAYGGRPAFRPAGRDPLLTRALPLASDLPRYRPASLGRDLVAGITVATLGIPSAMAYGQLAGLSPVNGF